MLTRVQTVTGVIGCAKQVPGIRGVRVWAILAIIFGFVLTTEAACGAQQRVATNGDIVGTWSGAGGSVVIFRSDGTFSDQALPLQLIAPDFFKGPHTGTGAWSLVAADRYEGQNISMIFG